MLSMQPSVVKPGAQGGQAQRPITPVQTGNNARTAGSRGPQTPTGRRSLSGRAQARIPQARPAVYPRETDVREYPKGVFETTWTLMFGDSDHKWGPWYKHVRAARKEGRWTEWKLKDIVAQEPNDRDEVVDPDEDARGARGRSSVGWDLRYQLAEDVRPAHIDVEEIIGGIEHPGDYSDEFFTTQWHSLYDNTLTLVEKYFDCSIDFRYLKESQEGPNQIWGMLLTEQFIEYARLVCQEDPKVGGWPAILNESAQRKWLIVGILAQIMEKKIFNELCFGADENIQAELERLDHIWTSKEGYGRKAARATTARYGMESGPMPRNFWNSVDDVSARTVKLFLPLLNVMKLVWPNDGQFRTQEAFLQELHFLFAQAGMIQVCTAVSNSIFHFLSATPGARMDYEIETQSDYTIYKESRDFYEQDNQFWNEFVKGSMTGRPTQNRTGYPIKVPANREEYNRMEYHRIRGARVKFAVFPQLTRYVPINKGVGWMPDLDHAFNNRQDMKKYMDKSEGQEVVNISKCWVVYRQGLIYPEDDHIETTTLDHHLSTISRQPNGIAGFLWTVAEYLFSIARHSFWHVLVIGGVVLLFLSLYVGSDFIQSLLVNRLPYMIFTSFCVISVTRVLFMKRHYASAYTLMGIPVAAAYLLGISYYVSNQTETVADAGFQAASAAAAATEGSWLRDALNEAAAASASAAADLASSA
ncbi:hypothetical protein F5B19DRAFT_490853 [Rostrohypoxylon terebratum]|nr:hypothetical protein F5B19DRAFT_490853 [Rostrohypoxylon terebratum]